MPGKSNLLYSLGKDSYVDYSGPSLQAEAPERSQRRKNMPWKSSKHYGNIGVREKEAPQVVENQD